MLKKEYKKNLLQILFTVIVIYIIIIATIHIIAPNSIIGPEEFPEACPEKSKNCTFIGPNPHRGEEISEIRFESNMSNVMFEVLKWVDSNSGEVLQEWPNHTHVVFRTFVWKFPDDFVVNLHCNEDQVVMYVYSKSRLGVSDLGVNNDRIESFTRHMLKAEMTTTECTYGG